jgi:hypothetical protein
VGTERLRTKSTAKFRWTGQHARNLLPHSLVRAGRVVDHVERTAHPQSESAQLGHNGVRQLSTHCQDYLLGIRDKGKIPYDDARGRKERPRTRTPLNVARKLTLSIGHGVGPTKQNFAPFNSVILGEEGKVIHIALQYWDDGSERTSDDYGSKK